MITPQNALIYTMVLTSAADRDMTDSELQAIGDIVKHLPVFKDYDPSQLAKAAQDCAALLADPSGLDNAVELILSALPEKLHETAYALACDVAAADGRASQEELRLLEWLRHALNLNRLTAAAIEQAARARHVKL